MYHGRVTYATLNPGGARIRSIGRAMPFCSCEAPSQKKPLRWHYLVDRLSQLTPAMALCPFAPSQKTSAMEYQPFRRLIRPDDDLQKKVHLISQHEVGHEPIVSESELHLRHLDTERVDVLA